jgi:hypothetical protein
MVELRELKAGDSPVHVSHNERAAQRRRRRSSYLEFGRGIRPVQA